MAVPLPIRRPGRAGPRTPRRPRSTAHPPGRADIEAFLTDKWERELGYALRKSLWCHQDNRIAVRFQCECHNAAGQWYRSYGNELWELDENGLTRRREASINDLAIDESQRRIFGPRPESERGIDIPLE